MSDFISLFEEIGAMLCKKVGFILDSVTGSLHSRIGGRRCRAIADKPSLLTARNSSNSLLVTWLWLSISGRSGRHGRHDDDAASPVVVNLDIMFEANNKFLKYSFYY